MKEQHVLGNENLLKILPFYNVLIDFMKEYKIKKLTNVELLNELPFYSGLKDTQKDPMVQLYSSKLCIKDLFKVLLYEIKGLNIRLRYMFSFSIKNKSSIM